MLLVASAAQPKFTNANVPYAFRFPADHGSHPGYQSEWWYYTGHLQTAAGRRFGYELTFFRIGLAPGDPTARGNQSRWRGNELYPAHFAITDERGGRFVHAQRLAREALGAGSAAQTNLDVRSGTWRLSGKPERDPRLERMQMHAAATFDGSPAALDLVHVPLKVPAIHGNDGVSQKAGCDTCASHYYSYTRLSTSGSILYGGQRLRVTGTSWMDHEFGSSQLGPDLVGWDWFSIQLDDGRELMLYRLRRADGTVTPQSSGSLIERNGSVTHLTLPQFSTNASGSWVSPHSNARYPSGWAVQIPTAGVDLVLAPTLADQELWDPSGVSYWEGAVNVRDARNGRPLGLGYVELTGYAGRIAL